MTKKLNLILMLVLFSLMGKAQTATPELEHIMDLDVKIGKSYAVGQTTQGTRNIIPITGGTFEGPSIKGTVVNGGADYQMIAADNSQSNLEAIYTLLTDDGTYIHIRNRGIVAGKYFYCSPTFEAPKNSKYAWLNNAIFVCKPTGFRNNGVQLRVWKVRDPYDFSSTITDIRPIPSSVRQPCEKQGKVETITYKTRKQGKELKKRARVYLPYGYNAKDKKTKYNVLYLMHGGGDNSNSFLNPPKNWLPLRQVLDHLIAERKIEPLIVVTPTFYDDDENIGENRMSDATRLTREFHKELQDYLIPQVERRFNTHLEGKDSTAVTRSRAHRAYGGFSMGALSTWFQLAYGANTVKHFLPLSGDLWVFDTEGEKQSADVAAKWLCKQLTDSPFKSDIEVYAYTGSKDIACKPQTDLIEALHKEDSIFRYDCPKANLRFSLKEGGQHYYGDINEYLYWALQTMKF